MFDELITDYIVVTKVNSNTKTGKFEITSKKTGEVLGHLHWMPGWRKYCFFPLDNTVWDERCLLSITQVLNKLMQERRGFITKKKRVPHGKKRT